jgi:hypothetical protein
MRRGPILIRGHLRALPAHPLTASVAPPHFHRVAVYFRLQGLRHIRDRRLVGPLTSQMKTPSFGCGPPTPICA